MEVSAEVDVQVEIDFQGDGNIQDDIGIQVEFDSQVEVDLPMEIGNVIVRTRTVVVQVIEDQDLVAAASQKVGVCQSVGIAQNSLDPQHCNRFEKQWVAVTSPIHDTAPQALG